MPLVEFPTRAHWIMILTPAGGGRRRHLLASNVWTKNLLSLGHKARRCRLCRVGDWALLGLIVPSERAPGCNWGRAMLGEERERQKKGKESARSPLQFHIPLQNALLEWDPRNQERCGEHRERADPAGMVPLEERPVLRAKRF